MEMSDYEFDKKMEEYRKIIDDVHLSDEAEDRIYQRILYKASDKCKNNQVTNQVDVQGNGGRKHNWKFSAALFMPIAVAMSVVFLGMVAIAVFTLSGQKSGQIMSLSSMEVSELQSETIQQDCIGQNMNNTEIDESDSENIEDDNEENNSGKTWLTSAQLLEYCENETNYNIEICNFVSYRSTLMCRTDSDVSALHFKRDGDGKIIYNERNVYDAYIVEEMKNAIAIVVDGHVCVYEEMEDIVFTIDGISYGISYALYDLIGTEEHSGNLIAEEDGVKVYEWLDEDGLVVEGKYFVNISDILVELMPDPYDNGEDWAEFYWVATEIT